MKQSKCNKCGNIQDYKLLNCQKCDEEMSRDIYKTEDVSKADAGIKEGAKTKGDVSPAEKSARYLTAIVVCGLIVIVYLIIGAAIGWRHGGGLIPMLLLFVVLKFTWSGIIGKKQDINKKTNSSGDCVIESSVTKQSKPDKTFKIILIVVFGIIILFIVGLFYSGLEYSDDEVDIVNVESVDRKDDISYQDFLKTAEVYLIMDVGTIAIPDSLEIQSGLYKTANDIYKKERLKKLDYIISGNDIVFQPKGINDLDSSGFQKYARVIVNTYIDNPGDYEKLTTDLSFLQIELDDSNELFKAEIEKGAELMDVKLVKWYGVKIVKINGISALKISFIRQMKDNPLVYVEMYKFSNYDMMHELTLSYRIEEKDVWKEDFENVLKSFTITNVR